MKAKGLMPVDEALGRLLDLAAASPIADIEELALARADGRVLGRDLFARIDSPPWANSAMDGYAFRLADLDGRALRVSQTIFAGQAPAPLEPGTCARIYTGAPLPEGADCVQIQENCTRPDDHHVLIEGQPRAGANVRPQADEIAAGEPLLNAGRILGPVSLGVLASQGYASVPVVRRPRVALLSTGDELVPPGQALAPGQIHDSNRTVLRALLQRLGCEVVELGRVGDDPQAICTALAAGSASDLILSSGGVSVGEADFIGKLLREQGEVMLWKLAIKPGKPFTFGKLEATPFIGLPGNPGSSLVTFLLLVRPYLLRRMGVAAVQPRRQPLPVGFDWPKAGTRQEYLRVRIEDGIARLLPGQSSGTLLSATLADGLLEIPAGRTFEAGEWLNFLPFDGLWGAANDAR